MTSPLPEKTQNPSPQPPQKPKWPFFLLGGVVLAMLLLVVGVGAMLMVTTPEREARAELNQLLGRNPDALSEEQAFPQGPVENPQAQEPSESAPLENAIEEEMDRLSQGLAEPPHASREQAPGPFPFGGNLMQGLNSAFAGVGMKINESDKAIVLSIPLSRPEDQKDITVKVGPHSVEVSGQLKMGGGANDSQSYGSTSFMRSFTTPSTLNPEKVTRTVEKKRLLITIPKLKNDAPMSFPQSEPTQPGTTSRQRPAAPQQDPISPGDLPTDGYI